MNITTKKTRKTIGLLENGGTLEFKFVPDSAAEIHHFEKDDVMIIGYLAHDHDAQDPLTSSDGMGHIHSTHRSAGKEDHNAFQKALGLNEYWDRDDSLPVNPYAVRLDCYSHSGTAWAVSGSEQARSFPDQQFDVAHGGGVWVPDECAQEECDRRAGVYTYFKITEAPLKTKTLYSVIALSEPFTSDANVHQKAFDDWGNAFEAANNAILEARDKGSLPSPTSEQIENGRIAAKEELAKEACNEYNQWLNDETYGIIIATYERDDKDSPWEEDFSKSDECWGYIGTKYAIEELDSQFKTACEDLNTESSLSMG